MKKESFQFNQEIITKFNRKNLKYYLNKTVKEINEKMKMKLLNLKFSFHNFKFPSHSVSYLLNVVSGNTKSQSKSFSTAYIKSSVIPTDILNFVNLFCICFA